MSFNCRFNYTPYEQSITADVSQVVTRRPGFAAVGGCFTKLADFIFAQIKKGDALNQVRAIFLLIVVCHVGHGFRTVISVYIVRNSALVVNPDLLPLAGVAIVGIEAFSAITKIIGPVF